jgi:hypothetical protein
LGAWHRNFGRGGISIWGIDLGGRLDAKPTGNQSFGDCNGGRPRLCSARSTKKRPHFGGANIGVRFRGRDEVRVGK